MSDEIKELFSDYKKKKRLIKKRLADFKKLKTAGNARLFAELCFCLCTPQSKAVNCDKAICGLKGSSVLFSGCQRKIAGRLKGLVRFHNNKAGYIVSARNKMPDLKNKIRALAEPAALRQWLVENIKGLGMKEASHFLRNIGLGEDLAIIDRHILTNMKKYGALREIPKHISEKGYLQIEEKIRKFSQAIEIPMAELDLLFWSQQTGHVFK